MRELWENLQPRERYLSPSGTRPRGAPPSGPVFLGDSRTPSPCDKFVTAALSGGETKIGDSYFLSQLRFETGAEKYKWLNRVLGVGEGRVYPGGIEYQVYEQAHD